MSASSYAVGVVELGALLAAAGLAAVSLRVLLLGGWTGAPARLAEVVLGIGVLTVVLELIGVVGLYRPGWVLIGGIVMSLAIAWLARRLAAPDRASPPSPAVSSAMLAVATIGALIVAALWAIPTQASLDIGMYLPNTTWQQMPFAVRFVQEAQVGALHFTDPTRVMAWFYPQNSELLHSAAVLFLDNDFLSPLLNMVWLPLCLLAAWCVGRPKGAGTASVLGVALILGTQMMLGYEPGDAKNDTMGLFLLLAAVALLVNADAAVREEAGDSDSDSRALKRKAGSARASSAPEPDSPPPTSSRWALTRFGVGPLLVAGLATGLTAGVKVSFFAAIGALTIGVIVVALKGERVRTAIAWFGAMFVGCGFWFIRNTVESGSPLPWAKGAGPINLPHPSQFPIDVRPPGTVAHYLTDGKVIKDWYIPGLHESFGPIWPVVIALFVGAILLVALRGESRTHKMLGWVGAFAAVVYLFTPLTASGDPGLPTGFARNIRYVSPGIAIAVAMLPLVPDLRRGRRPEILTGVLATILLITVIPSDVWDQGYRAGAVATALGVIAVPVLAVLALQRGISRTAVVASLLLIALGTVAVGRNRETHYLDGRYRAATAPNKIPEGIPEAMRWAEGVSDARIGIVDTQAGFKQYLFYGSDLSNHVQYIGEHGPHGAFLPIVDCRDWRTAINDGDYDYVITAPSHLTETTLPFENVWMSDLFPEDAGRGQKTIKFKHKLAPGVERVESTGPVTVFKLNGDLDPDACFTGELTLTGSNQTFPKGSTGYAPIVRQRLYPPLYAKDEDDS